MKRFVLVAVIFLISAYLSPTFAQSASPKTKTATDNDVQLTIISPVNDSTIFGSDVAVSFIINKFIFTDFAKRPNNFNGEGHMHIWLDENDPTTQNAQEIVKAADFTIHDVPPGAHTLMFELVNNNHNPLTSNIREIVKFETLEKQAETNATAVVTEPELEKKQKLLELTSISSIMTTGILIILLIGVFGFVAYWIKNQ